MLGELKPEVGSPHSNQAKKALRDGVKWPLHSRFNFRSLGYFYMSYMLQTLGISFELPFVAQPVASSICHLFLYVS
jgi:hypothetical protein